MKQYERSLLPFFSFRNRQMDNWTWDDVMPLMHLSRSCTVTNWVAKVLWWWSSRTQPSCGIPLEVDSIRAMLGTIQCWDLDLRGSNDYQWFSPIKYLVDVKHEDVGGREKRKSSIFANEVFIQCEFGRFAWLFFLLGNREVSYITAINRTFISFWVGLFPLALSARDLFSCKLFQS